MARLLVSLLLLLTISFSSSYGLAETIKNNGITEMISSRPSQFNVPYPSYVYVTICLVTLKFVDKYYPETNPQTYAIREKFKAALDKYTVIMVMAENRVRVTSASVYAYNIKMVANNIQYDNIPCDILNEPGFKDATLGEITGPLYEEGSPGNIAPVGTTKSCPMFFPKIGEGTDSIRFVYINSAKDLYYIFDLKNLEYPY